ncbi:MAG: FAD-dependent oxidoreductase, partial [Microbacterium sp.]|nr:FAD-dependent oxidoreductase [Microbacterium sp.]
MSRVVVIGAGVAGLATAGLLARDGHEVVVLERNDRVGGRAGTLEREGFRFDSGPSWYLMPEVFDHFFRMMGTSTEEQLDLTLLDPGYRVFRAPESAEGAVTVPAGRDAVRRLFDDLEPG